MASSGNFSRGNKNSQRAVIVIRELRHLNLISIELNKNTYCLSTKTNHHRVVPNDGNRKQNNIDELGVFV